LDLSFQSGRKSELILKSATADLAIEAEPGASLNSSDLIHAIDSFPLLTADSFLDNDEVLSGKVHVPPCDSQPAPAPVHKRPEQVALINVGKPTKTKVMSKTG
jgi:hypothetical protein